MIYNAWYVSIFLSPLASYRIVNFLFFVSFGKDNVAEEVDPN